MVPRCVPRLYSFTNMTSSYWRLLVLGLFFSRLFPCQDVCVSVSFFSVLQYFLLVDRVSLVVVSCLGRL